MTGPVNYGRMSNIFQTTGMSWTEHVWFVRADLSEPQLSDYENMSGRMQIWFEHEAGTFGISRKDLLPSGTYLRSNYGVNFFEDFVAELSPIFTAILDIYGTSGDPALPANVSKQIERRGRVLGRGLYGRWHTAGLTNGDVDVADSRRMDEDRRTQYAECYQQLQIDVETIVHGQPQYKLINAHRTRRTDADDPYGFWSYVQDIGIRSPYFGTMQIRTPGHNKAHGHGAPTP